MQGDPLYGSMQFLIDARDDEHYQAGHLTGAYQLDHYRADRYLPTLLPLLLPADKIIIYCNGGDCEDSELAARDLIENGISHTRIHVYLEGYKDWIARHEPVEKGERGSGIIAPGTTQ
jgi:rhodanese-related sulfurtransferase